MKTRFSTLAALVAPLAACGPEPAASDFGQVTLALQTTGAGDTVYGLDATLELVGPDTLSRVLSHVDADFQQSVRAGTYRATLLAYTLYEIVDGTAIELPLAELVTGNPTGVTVPANGTASLVFTFKTHGGDVIFGEGTLGVDLGVLEGLSWGSEVRLETPDDGDARDPHVAVDPMGNAVVAWSHRGTTNDVYVRHYEATSGSWGDPISLESLPGDAGRPLVATDPAGNAMAAWSQVDGTGVPSVFARRYDAVAGTWGSEASIESGGLGTRISDVAMDAAGNAIAVMYGSDGTHERILANRYLAGAGWGSEATLDPGGGDSFSPRVSIDPTGNAMVVWYRHDGTRYGVWVNLYDAAGGEWSGEVQLDTGVANAVIPQVGMDAAGNAMAVWYQFEGSLYAVLARRYDAVSDTWGSPVQLDRDTVESFTPWVAVDASGNGIVVWAQIEGGDYAIAARRYDVGAGSWGSEVVLASGMNNALEPRLALDAAGNAVALWSRWDGIGHGAVVSRYDAAGDRWETPLELASPIALLPAHAVDPSGRAIVVWSQSDGTNYQLFASRFY